MTCPTPCPGAVFGPMCCGACDSVCEQISDTYSDKEKEEMASENTGENKMKTLHFNLPIIPTAQSRPKVAVRGKFAQAYKTADQKANERTLEACLLEHRPKVPLSGPLVLEFVAVLPVPKSVSKTARSAMLAGWELPVKKPDIDNLAKQLLDAMTRLQFWGDDTQIVSLHCDKIYAEMGYWEVCVHDAVRRGGVWAAETIGEGKI